MEGGAILITNFMQWNLPETMPTQRNTEPGDEKDGLGVEGIT